MKKIAFFLSFLSLIFVIGCAGGDETNNGEAENSNEQEKVESICVWDKASVKAEPNKDGKYLTSISLGEKVYYLGENAVDATDKNREYIKVELSDGTTGWTSASLIKTDAYVAAIVEETKLYKRPDLLTITEKEYDVMEMVAVTDEKDGWIEVTGNKLKKQGWIKKDKITVSDEDVAVCILAHKQIFENGKIVEDKINNFVEEIPYKNSVFVSYLKKMAIPDKTEDIVEPKEEKRSSSVDGETIKKDSVKVESESKKGKRKGTN